MQFPSDTPPPPISEIRLSGMEPRPTSHHQGKSTSTSSQKRSARQSAFKELDLDTFFVPANDLPPPLFLDHSSPQPIENLRRRTNSSASSQSNESPIQQSHMSQSSDGDRRDRAKGGWTTFPLGVVPSRLVILAFTLLVAISFLYDTPLFGNAGPGITGAKAGVIKRSEIPNGLTKAIKPRQNTDTSVCTRWSQQSALINGTVYIYGGHATTQAGQKSNTWNNNFSTIDVTKSWDISSPSISGLPQPSGPPPVSNGYLWNSYDSLFLYGGEYSDSPLVNPSPYALWEYNIKSSQWTEHSNPQTSAGNHSEPDNQPVMGSAEGAGISIPELGRGWYFAGHEDEHTTPGWSNQIYRLYLKSLLEFTFPGYANDGVQNLGGGKTAGQDGAWRNITQGGIQDTNAFPSRADSVLVYVPGYGANGILVSIGGGTNESYVSTMYY